MTYHDIPILEFAPANDAALDPHRLIERIDMPEHCVVCFFQDVIAELIEVHQEWRKQSSVREKLFWLAAEACLEL